MSKIIDVHDAELYALRHDASAGTVQCVFRSAEGQEAVLLLSGISKFRCTDFGLQNVVLELVSTAWQEVSPDDLRSYVAWLFTTADGEQLAKADELELVVQDVVERRSQCLFLIPSWGAQLGAIAARIEWQ